ncbi:MAG: PAS domain S-box protein [Thermoplasmatota archaeon]
MEISSEEATQPKDTQKKLEMCNEKYLEFFESIQDWVWEMNVEGIHTYSNKAVKDILGYEVEEILNSCAWKFWPEEDKQKIDKKQFKKNLKKGEGWMNYPGRFKHKNGSIIYLESTAVPIYDEDNKLDGYRGVDRDITERKEMKERQDFLHSLLRHDVGNKTQIIDGYLQLAQNETSPDKKDEYISKARNATLTAKRIIEKVKTLMDLGNIEKIKKIELKKIVEDIIEEYQNDLENKDFEINFQKKNIYVQGGILLDELFSNLYENTIIHADCEKIRTVCQELENEVIVKIEDDGKGISENMKENVFKRGFTKGEYAGSGLGLHLVKEIAESYGGHVKVKDSELGGASFEIYLKKTK